MTLSVLRIGVSACVLAMAAATHAATPITLPFGDFGVQAAPELELPLPPPPKVVKPDVAQIRIVIKRQLVRNGCGADAPRRPTQERRQVGAGDEGAKPTRLG